MCIVVAHCSSVFIFFMEHQNIPVHLFFFRQLGLPGKHVKQQVSFPLRIFAHGYYYWIVSDMPCIVLINLYYPITNGCFHLSFPHHLAIPRRGCHKRWREADKGGARAGYTLRERKFEQPSPLLPPEIHPPRSSQMDDVKF